jgi:hypothetical protein
VPKRRIPLRKGSKPVARTIKGILRCREVIPERGQEGAERQWLAKATEAAKTWKAAVKNPPA